MPAEPDLVIRGAAVWKHPQATALAIKAGRVVALGSDEDVLARAAGSRTVVVDAGGATLLPGFQDAHAHPPMGGIDLMRCDVSSGRTVDDVRRIVREHVASLPEGEWLLGSGWEFHIMGPDLDRAFLDEIAPGRPAYLVSGGRHDALVSSAALSWAALHDGSPDPAHGRLGRRADGTLSGVLHEGAQIWFESELPPPGQEDYERAVLTAQQHFHSLGITAWQDAWTTPATLDAYIALARSDRLTARVRAALWWERDEGRDQIDRFVEQRRAADVGRLAAPAVKIMVDGTTGNQSAAVLEPYLDPGTGLECGCGNLFLPPHDLEAAVVELDALGFGVHLHAIGERAVREALDAVESARAVNGPTPGRHHVAHVCLVHPDDIPRFAALDVAANLQPLWAELNEELLEENRWLGDERPGWWYPFESLRAAGAPLCAGSDWPVSSADPLLGAYVAVRRLAPGTTDPDREVLMPHERMTVTDIVDAYTAGSARVNGLDGMTGAIGVGMLADLALLDRDLLTAEHDPETLGRVRLTLVDGEAVHDPEGLAT
ncbi:amidohydrolase [Nocardioides bigeumensis]|uniref:Amidohydrolase n=1 Tax=Nocardioides bigeumensis TaxID=433657 RepID=A0ABN2YZQ0_9ACTN